MLYILCCKQHFVITIITCSPIFLFPSLFSPLLHLSFSLPILSLPLLSPSLPLSPSPPLSPPPLLPPLSPPPRVTPSIFHCQSTTYKFGWASLQCTCLIALMLVSKGLICVAMVTGIINPFRTSIRLVQNVCKRKRERIFPGKLNNT